MADDSGGDKSPLDKLREILTEEELGLLLRQAAEHGSSASADPDVWRPPTEEEFERWVTPLDALDVSDFRLADDAEVWALVEQLKAGQIDSVARTAQSGSIISGVEPFVPVLPRHWRLMGYNEQDRFFKTGHLVVPVLNNLRRSTGHYERFFDIRFNPKSLSGGPVVRLPDPEASPKPAKIRGAKRKDWWDHLWIEMIRRIRAGTLTPKSKAELQATLEDYVDEIGGNYGDSTLKPMASNLFEYLEEIRGK